MDKVEILKDEHIEDIKIGFLLELDFRQNFIHSQITEFINFLSDNYKFFNTIDFNCFSDSVRNINDLFFNYINLVYNDVDSKGDYLKFHRDFY